MANYLSLYITGKTLFYGVSDNSVQVNSSDQIPLDPEIRDLLPRFTEAVRELKSRIPENIEECTVAVSSEYIFYRELNFPYNAAQVHKTIHYDIEEFIPYDIEDVAISYTITSPGKQCRVMVAACMDEVISGMISVLNEVDLDPKAVEPDMASMLNLWKFESDPGHDAENHFLIHILPDTTNICLIEDDRLVSVRAIRETLAAADASGEEKKETEEAIRKICQSLVLMETEENTPLRIAGPEPQARAVKEMLEQNTAASAELEPAMIDKDVVLNGGLIRITQAPWIDLNFRRGKYAYKGVWEKLMPPLAVFSGCLLLCFIVLNLYTFRMQQSIRTSIQNIQSAIRRQYQKEFKVDADQVPGMDILKDRLESSKIEIKREIGEDPSLPDIIPIPSLLYMFYSRLPEDLDIDINSLQIDQKRLNVTATVPDISDIDRLLEVYRKGPVLDSPTTVGQIRIRDNRRFFTMRMRVNHSKKETAP